MFFLGTASRHNPDPQTTGVLAWDSDFGETIGTTEDVAINGFIAIFLETFTR